MPTPRRIHVPALLFSLGLTVGIAWLDARTVYELSFSAFYLIPIAIATWWNGRALGIATSLLCLAGWLIATRVSGHVYSHPFYLYWGAFNELLSFLALAFILGWLRKTLRAERAANDALSRALDNVKELEGLLPICSWCKKIRNDKGTWEAIETYVGRRSKATFTHGMCAECRSRAFPDAPTP